MTDRQTDGRGALQYLPSRAFGAAGDNNIGSLHHKRVYSVLLMVKFDMLVCLNLMTVMTFQSSPRMSV